MSNDDETRRVAIVGSRDYPTLNKVIEYVRGLPQGTLIISGGARGVDTIAVDAAKECGLEFLVFEADWEKYGPSAGPRRNRKIAEACDEVVAFWDGSSRGTMTTVKMAQELGKPVTIFDSLGGSINS